MPDVDGYTLLRRLRDAGIRVPAVLRALAAGYQTYLAKPVDPGELVAVVASLARRL
jgi:DNA-binding response OmpR family regulator